ncbi:MAG: ABC transporter substrate-binding protein, partial [Acidobacteria bacterium]|nr:ABC transporter substrate-binding protein [Acidobacteriota bacterium]
WGKPLIASQPWVAELVEAAGGEFVTQPGRPVTSAEVEEAMPEVWVTAWCGAGNRVPLEKILRARKWEKLPAALTRRIYSVPDEYLNTPAPTLLCGLEALAAAIHPANFPQPPGLRWIGPAR